MVQGSWVGDLLCFFFFSFFCSSSPTTASIARDGVLGFQPPSLDHFAFLRSSPLSFLLASLALLRADPTLAGI